MSMKVLTVCLGNICRSPAAQGILQAKADKKGIDIILDSAGTAAYHVGNHPDSRSIAELANRSIDITNQRARQVSVRDFDEFDWILAMDKQNLRNLMTICPKNLQHKVHMFGTFTPNAKEIKIDLGEVEDPYYGADDGFSTMADHLELLADHFFDSLNEYQQAKQ